MAQTVGRNVRLTPFRRLVTDLMYFSTKVPSVTIERRMNLARLAMARQACAPRPGWCIVFTKAFAIVAARHPELRQSYMTFPWPRLYEHPHNIATLNIDRHDGDERIVMYAHLRRPESQPLARLNALVRRYQETPLDQLAEFKRARKLSLLPGPLRRLIFWGGLNVFGRRRSHNFGTFGITSTCAQGTGILRIIPLLTSTLHYGLLDSAGWLDMRLSFDHRVLDGAQASQSLVEMEHVLHHEILDELRSLRDQSAAA
jgi:hypothetical protein